MRENRPSAIEAVGHALARHEQPENAYGVTRRRCVYHGWKFDVTGAVMDMPAEPAAQPPQGARAHQGLSLPGAERRSSGPIWVLTQADPPPLPNVEWNLVPQEQVLVTLRVQECNWLQAVEGEIDSGARDHRCMAGWMPRARRAPGSRSGICVRHSNACKQDFGMSIAARRQLRRRTRSTGASISSSCRSTRWCRHCRRFPDLSGHAWVPIDDENTLCIMFSYHPSEPLSPKHESDLSRRAQRARKRARQPALLRREAADHALCRVLDEVQSEIGLSVRLREPEDARGSPGCRGYGCRTRPANPASRRCMTAPRSICAPATPAS